MEMFKCDPEIYDLAAVEMERVTGNPPPYVQIDAFVHLMENMPSEELREIIEEERKHLQRN
jgi:hypothetical protein